METPVSSIRQTKRWSVVLFLFGVGLAVLLVLLPGGRQTIAHLADWGYVGIFLAGALYSFALTSGIATLVLASHVDTVNPILAACVGGIGSMIYDVIVFTVIRRNIHVSFLERFQLKKSRRRRLAHWLLNALGVLILASPLPDELAAGLLSLSGMRKKLFMAISFVANTIGILIILLST